jgi:hypothetical protein
MCGTTPSPGRCAQPNIMKIGVLVSFCIYSLILVGFTLVYVETQPVTGESFTYHEGTPGFIVVLSAFGYAAGKAAQELGIWLRFIAYCIIFNILFLFVLKFIGRFTWWELMFLLFATHAVGFFGYCLLYPILQSVLGEYHSITFTLFTITYFLSRWTLVKRPLYA